MPESDWEIFERVKNGDELAFKEIYEKFKLPLYRFCLRMVFDEDTAIDIVHDVFMKIYENKNLIEPASFSLSTLLFKIAKNRCLNFLRDRREKIQVDSVEINSGCDVEKNFEVIDAKEKLQRILNLLDDDYRAILILREWNGLSYSEIAKIFDTSVSAVKAKLFKARRKLAEIYKKYYGDE
ncbi:RNA polymerase sigma-70 factor, ECF subfamily [Candidatus Kryptobacter tengchongensis]|uniref:RNA polymerase sigma-70 factor, ECF subfamily n=1 Tax=Kryptobacter tengchongensis TaxID=1643429 RepID=A0A916LKJ2_KRYT1|nr:RNA polymerase sigma factor [Candidatus Kryptobacter tengchongensis]CUS80487.1 RNA polymerase sigma-70 factor, ECF subfamily [Candidatus Kryptobacter tengchongensis]CUT05015.1 RNA polymerase sigma-70 factor, ECF subfamily [Candidatus Kryptobacter tengchongensis]CUU05734.1 RNA polymerase sigma-70 factor, ECF subfamily [Candidatus Kryptobacter tengchongensis]